MKVRKDGGEEIPLVQRKEQWLHFAGAAVKRYPTPKIPSFPSQLEGKIGLRRANPRGSLRFLPPLEMRPSSIATNPVDIELYLTQ